MPNQPSSRADRVSNILTVAKRRAQMAQQCRERGELLEALVHDEAALDLLKAARAIGASVERSWS